MIRRTLFAVVCLVAAAVAEPPLTTIQDVLYKADGTRFNGTLTISWNSFQSADNSDIVTQTSTVKVVEGNLRVQLVPTTTLTPTVYYTVTYNSDGRVQFQENWAVPASATPLRVRDVRVAAPVTSTGAVVANDTSGGPVPESDVVGLIADLGGRRHGCLCRRARHARFGGRQRLGLRARGRIERSLRRTTDFVRRC
jgi:hypothetical protein